MAHVPAGERSANNLLEVFFGKAFSWVGPSCVVIDEVTEMSNFFPRASTRDAWLPPTVYRTFALSATPWSIFDADIGRGASFVKQFLYEHPFQQVVNNPKRINIARAKFVFGNPIADVQISNSMSAARMMPGSVDIENVAVCNRSFLRAFLRASPSSTPHQHWGVSLASASGRALELIKYAGSSGAAAPGTWGRGAPGAPVPLRAVLRELASFHRSIVERHERNAVLYGAPPIQHADFTEGVSAKEFEHDMALYSTFDDVERSYRTLAAFPFSCAVCGKQLSADEAHVSTCCFAASCEAHAAPCACADPLVDEAKRRVDALVREGCRKILFFFCDPFIANHDPRTWPYIGAFMARLGHPHANCTSDHTEEFERFRNATGVMLLALRDSSKSATLTGLDMGYCDAIVAFGRPQNEQQAYSRPLRMTATPRPVLRIVRFLELPERDLLRQQPPLEYAVAPHAAPREFLAGVLADCNACSGTSVHDFEIGFRPPLAVTFAFVPDAANNVPYDEIEVGGHPAYPPPHGYPACSIVLQVMTNH